MKEKACSILILGLARDTELVGRTLAAPIPKPFGGAVSPARPSYINKELAWFKRR